MSVVTYQFGDKMQVTFLSVPYQQLEMIKKQITQASGMAAHSSVSCEAGPRGAAEETSRAAGKDKTPPCSIEIQLLGDADQLFIQSTYAKAPKDGLVHFLPVSLLSGLGSLLSLAHSRLPCVLCFTSEHPPVFALREYDFNSLFNNGSCCLQTVKKPSLTKKSHLCNSFLLVNAPKFKRWNK